MAAKTPICPSLEKLAYSSYLKDLGNGGKYIYTYTCDCLIIVAVVSIVERIPVDTSVGSLRLLVQATVAKP